MHVMLLRSRFSNYLNIHGIAYILVSDQERAISRTLNLIRVSDILTFFCQIESGLREMMFNLLILFDFNFKNFCGTSDA